MTPLDTLLIQAYTGGVNMPLEEEAGKLAVAELGADGKMNLAYIAAAAAVSGDDTLATALASHLRGMGLTVDASNNLSTRVRPRKCPVQDYFIGGNSTSGSIGKLGWNLHGSGTYARTGNTGLDSGFKADLTSGNSNGDRYVLALGDTESRTIARPEELEILQFVVRIATTKASVRHFLGFQSDFAQIPSAATDCLGLYFDSGINANNWLTLARTAGVGTSVNTGVSAALDTSLLITLHRVGTTVNFYVGNTSIGSVASGMPLTTAMNLGYKVQTLTNAVRTMRIGYFGMDGRTLGGAFDDDTFLEV